MTHVLVIDDEEMVRKTIKMILEKVGFEVSLAGNGKQGMEMVVSRPPELIITDMIMPEMDGVETTMEIRSKYPDIKIVAISGGGRVHNLDFLKYAKEMGAHAILPKPFTKEELLGAVLMAMENG
ncbi:MAG: hypothetical protein A3G18_05680 [Rhodospirillales bacterium RIFCSPLOWO2_12_FULL_58_28]|nr:MAG: hypothetical protein A3H92_00680 [Rhodospirillales bacterium RIFCSPLOWO2_02_FULL_58_16]OHC79435.1 MAG: hypothetical protein A3G18_05680 [Rhodospirillales bacterium RIFCSPLOWO2_12_FULL_58_28]